MSFIETIPDTAINGDVNAMYERQRAHWGFVPNYAKVFCYRPDIMRLWGQLQAGIKQTIDRRRFELVTFAASIELRSTLCSLAHGKALTQFISAADVQKIARGERPESLPAAEIEMIAFARLVARDGSAVKPTDIERLKHNGFSDAEIFDIAATVAARSFWTKLLESLGVEAEPSLRTMETSFVETLSVGRPVGPQALGIEVAAS